jgi:phage baseplate assembly protein W
MSNEFVGAGWAFPLRLDYTGGFELVTDDREIQEAVRLIIGTAYGERPMRPDFGCAIHDFVFADADAATAGRIAYEVRVSLRRWEPRIEIDDVEVTIDEQDRSLLYVEVRYRIKNTNDPRNLVFPFYTIPPEPNGQGAAT